jgi:hypothetical protein
MKSILHESEEVANSDRRLGQAQRYFPATVVLLDGQRMPALFTQEQVQTAIDRARYNPEDMPRLSWWDRAKRVLSQPRE